ncbi:MAG: dihydroorotate dehydrogenase electron transfer subunit [Woeseiaceae bacterium]|nr:dihydroorotate dehydrogenase electron transfer subunit [Woeseiaceae bacterium]
MTTDAQRHAQRNRNTIFVEDGEIVSIDRYEGEQFIQRIRTPKCAAAARAGSFVHITCDEGLPMRRPLSIMRVGDDWIEVLYKIVGEGLRLLSQKGPGGSVSVMGPIGRPFDLDPDYRRPLLIGGGVGIPPMVFVADALQQSDADWSPFAILGSEIPFPFALEKSGQDVAGIDPEIDSTMALLESWGTQTRLTSLAGFEGCFRGYVTDLAEHWLQSLDEKARGEVMIYACGPTPMLKAVADLAARHDLPCQVSMEEYMACAVGGCAGCAIRIDTPDGPAMKRVCVDGPVFDAYSIDWAAA